VIAGLAAGAAADLPLENDLVDLKGVHGPRDIVASSWVLGTLSYAAFGPGAYALVCAYFIVGSLVRWWR